MDVRGWDSIVIASPVKRGEAIPSAEALRLLRTYGARNDKL